MSRRVNWHAFWADKGSTYVGQLVGRRLGVPAMISGQLRFSFGSHESSVLSYPFHLTKYSTPPDGTTLEFRII